MGIYYTCNECGATAKGVWPCDCPRKLTLKNIRARVGCKILKSCHGFDGVNEYLYEKLQSRKGETFYHATCLGGGGGEYDNDWKIVEISKKEFDAHYREFSRQRCRCVPYEMCEGCAERSLKIAFDEAAWRNERKEKMLNTPATFHLCQEENWKELSETHDHDVYYGSINGQDFKICYLHWDCNYMSEQFEVCKHPKCPMGRYVHWDCVPPEEGCEAQIFCTEHYTGAPGTEHARDLKPLFV